MMHTHYTHIVPILPTNAIFFRQLIVFLLSIFSVTLLFIDIVGFWVKDTVSMAYKERG